MSDHDRDDEPQTKIGPPPVPVASKERTLQGGVASMSEGSAPHQGVQPGIVYRFFGRSDVGVVREHNEDNFVAADLSDEVAFGLDQEFVVRGTLSDNGLLLAVCDGMGGALAGEDASKMAVETVLEVLRDQEPTDDRDVFARRLVECVEIAGDRIFAEAKKDREKQGMGTTATVAGLIDKVLFIGQVGDSRCYVVRNGRMDQLTKDQSLVNQLIEAGQLDPAEAEEFEFSNIILQALGTTPKVSVDLTFLELRRGDRIMLCSDGLCGLVHDDVVEDLLVNEPDPQRATQQLIDLANAAGGHDNITCIVADFDGQDLATPEDDAQPCYQQYPLPWEAGDSERVSTGPVIRTLVPRPSRTSGISLDSILSESATQSAKKYSWSSAVMVLLLFASAALTVVIANRTDQRRPFMQGVMKPIAKGLPREVRVTTNIDDGVLFVNGHKYGPLSAKREVLLELSAGLYKFECVTKDGIHLFEEVQVGDQHYAEVALILPSEDENVGDVDDAQAVDEDEDDSTTPSAP